MKERKQKKQAKKQPGQFLKTKQRNKNIQHNREQLKLLKEKTVETVELFILEPDGFKKVTTAPFLYTEYDKEHGQLDAVKIVYLANNGKKSKLRTAHIVPKRSNTRCCLDVGNDVFIDWEHCFGVVVKEEFIKEHTK